MATPISSATSYASPDDLMNYFDMGKIGQYATDGQATLTAGAIRTDTRVLAALLRASGELEMACFCGERYTPTDLAALTGASAAALKGLVCDMAMFHLAKRRVPRPEEMAGYKEAMEKLQALRDGILIFGLQEAAEAGQMSTVDVSTYSDGTLRRPTELARRLFGRRMDDFSSHPLTGSG